MYKVIELPSRDHLVGWDAYHRPIFDNSQKPVLFEESLAAEIQGATYNPYAKVVEAEQ